MELLRTSTYSLASPSPTENMYISGTCGSDPRLHLRPLTEHVRERGPQFQFAQDPHHPNPYLGPTQFDPIDFLSEGHNNNTVSDGCPILPTGPFH